MSSSDCWSQGWSGSTAASECSGRVLALDWVTCYCWLTNYFSYQLCLSLIWCSFGNIYKKYYILIFWNSARDCCSLGWLCPFHLRCQLQLLLSRRVIISYKSAYTGNYLTRLSSACVRPFCLWRRLTSFAGLLNRFHLLYHLKVGSAWADHPAVAGFLQAISYSPRLRSSGFSGYSSTLIC